MYDLIINNEQIDKNFHHVLFHDENLFDGYVQLFPKKIEIFEYWKYFKRYGSTSGLDPAGKKDSYFFKYHSFLDIFYNFVEIPKYKISTVSYQECYMKFKFPDEETALYFKLKYC